MPAQRSALTPVSAVRTAGLAGVAEPPVPPRVARSLAAGAVALGLLGLLAIPAYEYRLRTCWQKKTWAEASLRWMTRQQRERHAGNGRFITSRDELLLPDFGVAAHHRLRFVSSGSSWTAIAEGRGSMAGDRIVATERGLRHVVDVCEL